MEAARGPLIHENPLGLDGLDFVEFTTADAPALDALFLKFGFQRIGRHRRRRVTLFRQNQINFIINEEPGSFADAYQRRHGASVCALGFRVRSAPRAFDLAVARGARPSSGEHAFPAVHGVGGAVIYFIDRYRAPVHFDDDFRYLQPDLHPRGRGLIGVDHVTQAVPKGELARWVAFYRDVFGFREARGFDVRGERTGLIAKVLSSPCRRITVQLLEPTEARSQVQEFLDEHRGAGVRHLALASGDAERAVRAMGDSGLRFLSTTHGSHCTRPVIGSMFLEIVDRRPGGELLDTARGVFSAIEKDQILRGYL